MRGILSWSTKRRDLQTAVAVCRHRCFRRFPSAALTPLLLALAPLPLTLGADLRREVSRLSANDQHQDIRIYNLERDVDTLQRKVQYTPKSPSAMATTSGKSPVASTTVSGKSPVTPPAPETSYTVRPGDTLWRIAMNHRISPGEIMQLNGLRSDTVQTGQKLRIPARGGSAPSPTPSPTGPKSSTAKTAPPASGTHVIGSGDTFSGIAQRYGVSQSALQQANPGVNPNVILIGSRLNIPSGGKSPANTPSTPSKTAGTGAPPPAPASPSATDSGRRHAVKSGDTLTSIAAAYGVTTAALQHANQISDPNRLKLGQQLVIPSGTSKPANIVRSTPPAGSSPSKSSSAPAYPGTNTGALSATDTAQLTPSISPGPAPQENPRGVLIYRVHSTDTIESIASTFGTTPQKIRELNRKPADSKVTPNEEILVPAMGAVGL